MIGDSQLASQLNAQESQFMRATGNIVSDADAFRSRTTTDPRPKAVI